MEKGIPSGQALELGIINKAFDPFERQLVADAVWARIPRDADRSKLVRGADMDREDIESRRAENQFWNGAENYQLRADFQMYRPDGEADLYFNTIIGLGVPPL